MKVLAILNHLELGGTQINAVDFAHGLRAHGIETVFIGPKETLPQGASLLDIAAARGFGVEVFETPSSTMSGARIFADFARKHAVDLVHVYSIGARPTFWGPCLFGRRPLVVTVYEMQVTEHAARYGTELIVGAGYLLEGIDGRKGGVHLISPPVDLDRDNCDAIDISEFMASGGIDRDRVRIVIVSRLANDMKAFGIETAMKTVERFGADGPQLIVVGTGDAEERLRNLAGEINGRIGRNAVHMAGALSDPRPAYACADIMIGMGGSAARSLAFGKPLIASGEHGWFETFTPQTSAKLFRNSFWSDERLPDPEGELFPRLASLLSDAAERRSLGDYGRAFARQHFGLGEMTNKLAGIYRKARAEYGFRRWYADLPLEAQFLKRRLQSA